MPGRYGAVVRLLVVLVVLALAVGAPGAVFASQAKAPLKYSNCTNLNKLYPHGVGKLKARDRTSSGDEPVTNFKRSTKIYLEAMKYNRGLDRDKDGVACEKD